MAPDSLLLLVTDLSALCNGLGLSRHGFQRLDVSIEGCESLVPDW
jgi:hypothetical protein